MAQAHQQALARRLTAGQGGQLGEQLRPLDLPGLLQQAKGGLPQRIGCHGCGDRRRLAADGSMHHLLRQLRPVLRIQLHCQVHRPVADPSTYSHHLSILE
ncbi:hypothetical protein D3C87_1888880 [compost metagenome]